MIYRTSAIDDDKEESNQHETVGQTPDPMEQQHHKIINNHQSNLNHNNCEQPSMLTKMNSIHCNKKEYPHLK